MDTASTWELGHVGDGASVQRGEIREEGRIAQAIRCTRVLRGRGQAGRVRRMVWSKWVEATQFESNTIKLLTLYGAPVSQATVSSAFLPLQALESPLGTISLGPGSAPLSVWLSLLELCSLPLSPHGRHLSRGFPFPEH